MPSAALLKPLQYPRSTLPRDNCKPLFGRCIRSATMIPFNVKKHSDITITVSGDAAGDEKTFYLHKFPLISKSQYFDDNIPESATSGATEMIIKDFPGGPNAFEIVAKYCYGIDIELTVDNIAYVYCASRVLRVTDLEKSTEAFMTEVVLRDPAKSAVVLKVATGIANMSDAMMEGLVGHCINAIASMFAPLPELNALPADCFSCIVRTARDMDANKRTLEAAVVSFLDTHIGDDVAGASSAAGADECCAVAMRARMLATPVHRCSCCSTAHHLCCFVPAYSLITPAPAALLAAHACRRWRRAHHHRGVPGRGRRPGPHGRHAPRGGRVQLPGGESAGAEGQTGRGTDGQPAPDRYPFAGTRPCCCLLAYSY